MQETTPQPPLEPTSQKGGLSRWTVLSVVGVVVLLSSGYFWQRNQANQAELAAIEALKSVRAIVVLDADRRFAQSVNLSTVPPEQFETAVERLSAMRHVEAVDLSRTSFQDGHIDAFRHLGSVKSLVLTDTQITDEASDKLADYLPKLESLLLAGTQVTSASLDNWVRLRSLKILDLSRTASTEGFERLASLPGLEWFLLREVDVAAGALMPLVTSESLQRLSLNGAAVDDQTLESLRDAGPAFAVRRAVTQLRHQCFSRSVSSTIELDSLRRAEDVIDFRVVSTAVVMVDDVIDIVADLQDGTVTQRHVKSPHVSAAEVVVQLHAGPILARKVCLSLPLAHVQRESVVASGKITVHISVVTQHDILVIGGIVSVGVTIWV